MVTYDDTHQESCTFGSNYCYKQVMHLTMDDWPSKKPLLNESLNSLKIVYKYFMGCFQILLQVNVPFLHVRSFYLFAVITTVGGCLMPMSEPFLNNENVMASYMPENFDITEFSFEKCSGSNCFDIASDGKFSLLIFFNFTFDTIHHHMFITFNV